MTVTLTIPSSTGFYGHGGEVLGNTDVSLPDPSAMRASLIAGTGELLAVGISPNLSAGPFDVILGYDAVAKVIASGGLKQAPGVACLLRLEFGTYGGFSSDTADFTGFFHDPVGNLPELFHLIGNFSSLNAILAAVQTVFPTTS